MGHLFGTSGIRGSAGSLFTDQFCFDLGQTFAKFLDKHNQVGPVAVGMDSRSSSPRILESIASGLVFAGREVFSQGLVPVPAMNYLLKVAPYAGSLMVSGSHIDDGLNGVKFFSFQEEILKEHEKDFEKIFSETKEKNPFQKNFEQIYEENKAKENYEEMLMSLAEDNFPSWQVVVDPGNGAQSEVMPAILVRLGLKVTVINDNVQGGFIARDTEVEGVLQNLQKEVVKQKADFGIAFDVDGDRVVFVDEKGKFVPGDYTGSLIAKETPGEVIVTPINTSQAADHLGKTVIRTKVGSPYVVEAMKNNGANFGFEANGGGISSEIMMSRDGGSTTVKIIKLFKKSGLLNFSKLIAGLPQFFLYRLKVDCPPELNPKILADAKNKFPGIKTEEIDGLKIWLSETTWILFRPSSNAAEFRVFAEAKDSKTATKLGEDGIQLVKEIVNRG